MKPEKRYCRKCGRELYSEPLRADKAIKKYMYGQDMPVASRFDSITGKENYVQMYRCANYVLKKTFLYSYDNGHDNYFLDDIFHVI